MPERNGSGTNPDKPQLDLAPLLERLDRGIDRIINRIDLIGLDASAREMSRRAEELREVNAMGSELSALERVIAGMRQQISDLQERVQRLDDRNRGF